MNNTYRWPFLGALINNACRRPLPGALMQTIWKSDKMKFSPTFRLFSVTFLVQPNQIFKFQQKPIFWRIS
jgi:hypothetical protein